MPLVADKPFLDQVERILHSDEMHGAEELRRLLKFLAEKTVSGEADELKEYVVAIDGLGKPSTYDPRQKSTVRIQLGRLRQKLTSYYQTEGTEDPLLIDIPKGRFKLKCESRVRAVSPPEVVSPPSALGQPDSVSNRPVNNLADHRPSKQLWVGAAIAIVCCLCAWFKPWSAHATRSPTLPGWTSELEDLWGPFIASHRQLIVAIEDPLFVQFQAGEGVYYRDRSLNSWNDVQSAPVIQELRHTLLNPTVQPSLYYTSFGEASVSFLIGKFLGPRVQNFSLTKSTDLSWEQMSDSDVLFIGMQNRFFQKQMKAMPIQVQLQPVQAGIRNVHPKPGEPVLFADQIPTTPSGAGVVYALVTHIPGPMGNNDVESFTSSDSAGYVAAVKSFTDPGFARIIVKQLRDTSGGKMPRYYQVLFKVQFIDETPTETTCVLTRALR